MSCPAQTYLMVLVRGYDSDDSDATVFIIPEAEIEGSVDILYLLQNADKKNEYYKLCGLLLNDLRPYIVGEKTRIHGSIKDIFHISISSDMNFN
jgi:hypothetical protein